MKKWRNKGKEYPVEGPQVEKKRKKMKPWRKEREEKEIKNEENEGEQHRIEDEK